MPRNPVDRDFSAYTFICAQRISGVIRTYHARVLCVSRPRYVRITFVIREHFIYAIVSSDAF